VIRPDVLLLDEPLSNLDAKLRLEMREEIRRIHAETRITPSTSRTTRKRPFDGRRIAVMRDGQVEQVGDPGLSIASRRAVLSLISWAIPTGSRRSVSKLYGRLVLKTEIGMFAAAEQTRARRAARFARFSA
jgi:ABC-type multidrug transport system ATPase subunit